jgi:hypothetical protein
MPPPSRGKVAALKQAFNEDPSIWGGLCAVDTACSRHPTAENRWHHGPVKLLALIGIALVSGGAAKPALRPLDLDPLTLSATGFRANERVKLLLSAPPVSSTRTVRAGVRGRFRVVFRIGVGRCDSVVVQAIGARGSRATFHRDAPDCASP